MAELLQILDEQFDYPQLTDEILRFVSFSLRCSCLYRKLIRFSDVSNKEFNANDTKGPRSISAFVVKLSELTPRLVLKQMTLLIKQLDSEVFLVLHNASVAV
jgi:condensin complex subunit 1